MKGRLKDKGDGEIFNSPRKRVKGKGGGKGLIKDNCDARIIR